MDENGLVTIRSPHRAQETMLRLEAAVKSKGMTVFAHIDHAAAAAEAGLALRATDLLIFGSPKGGTPLMEAAQTIGIDLPLKALVWEDGEGTTWISYNDPAWLARRHDLPRALQPQVEAMAGALAHIAQQASKSP
ncbi:MAG: DUF302 domain-containing protein [Hyphomicrobiales bacterium]|nr:DUF302 domain-containing protein [Hyphomicrobiales bacterium]